MLRILLAAALLFAPAHAFADEAAELLRKYDAQMGPDSFTAVSEMAAHRDDGSVRTYEMRILKRGQDRSRVYFDAPASARGQEMLRVGDNMWIYMPNLKRAIRIASRESFQGGDFNNADVLRADYTADYLPTLVGHEGDVAHLSLRAKSPEVAYDRIELWLRKDGLPVKAQFFASSGKLTRSAEFKDYKDFDGVTRPAYILMRNELATKRFSEMRTDAFALKKDIPAGKFVLDDLGK